MRLFALAHLAMCTISASIGAVTATIVHAVDQLLAFILENASPAIERLERWPSLSAIASPGMAFAGPSGERHEAAVPRRSAQRNI